MVFVDGGYLREYLKKRWGNDEFTADGFDDLIYHIILNMFRGNVEAEIIRTYYYDAMADEADKEKREEQKAFFSKIRQVPFCTVRLGRLIKTGKQGYRQKGVDTLMAIDMLSKAYENHYEIAILVAGDDDFVDLVEAVKNAGKRVIGAYIQDNVSNQLLESFDIRVNLTEQILRKLLS